MDPESVRFDKTVKIFQKITVVNVSIKIIENKNAVDRSNATV